MRGTDDGRLPDGGTPVARDAGRFRSGGRPQYPDLDVGGEAAEDRICHGESRGDQGRFPARNAPVVTDAGVEAPGAHRRQGGDPFQLEPRMLADGTDRVVVEIMDMQRGKAFLIQGFEFFRCLNQTQKTNCKR